MELPAKCYFDERKVKDTIEWHEEYCTHPTGDLEGKRLILPEWYKTDFIAPVFGIINEDTGVRQYHEVYELVASGNAKSTLGTATGLYCLCYDGQNSPRVYSVAGSREQAGIIFNGAKMMVQNNSDLSREISIFRNSLTIQSDKYGLGVFMALAADSDLLEGLNPTAVFMDELHVQANGKLFYNLKKNLAKRKEGLIWSKTTAGVVFTFAHEYHVRAKKILDGIMKAPGFYAGIYEADAEGDDFDVEQWKMANPGWDYLNKNAIYQAAEDAKKSAAELSAFKRYRLNKWVAASQTWLSDAQWMKGTECLSRDEDELRQYRKEKLTFESLRGRKCFVGVDLSNNRDTSAAVFVFPPVTPGERVKIIPRVYIPIESFLDRVERETQLYHEWKEHDEIIVTGGLRQDQERIFEDIQDIGKIVTIEGVAYDNHNAGEIVRLMEKSGVPCRAYAQDFKYMNAPMRSMDTHLSKDKIEHGGHPVLRWHCGNTEALTRMRGGAEYIMPTKSTEMARIDCMVATIIGYGFMVWQMGEPDEAISQSIVKNQGIVSIKLRR